MKSAWRAAWLGAVMGASNLATTLTLLGVGTSLFSLYIFSNVDLDGLLNKEKEKKEEEEEEEKESESPAFTKHEQILLPFLVPPSRLKVEWADVGGCEVVMEGIMHQVVYPLLYAHLHQNHIHPLLHPPKGVLFYGPPGCGKTLLAKAIASEVKASFLNLDISLVRNMWLGETEKLAKAVFTLAHKLAPCIIFLDEVDTFLSSRDHNDSSANASLKSIFLQSWDGLTTDTNSGVLVLAATNRMDAIDSAILRRLSIKFKIPKPGVVERLKILSIHVRGTPLAADVNLTELAHVTDGLSGSDLHEVCRCASVLRLVDYMADHNAENSGTGVLRDLTMEDLMQALTITRSKSSSSSIARNLYL